MKRLTKHHPLSKALEEIFDLMDKHGIRISVNGLETAVEYDGKVYSLKDIEDGYHTQHPMDTFPPGTEYKLLIEDLP